MAVAVRARRVILARDLAGGLVILALAILALAGAWLPVAAQGTQGDGLRFGVGAAGAWGAEATALGVSWEQVSIEWAVIQPEADAFETEALDSRIEAARAAGRAVIGEIVATPEWASASGERFAVPEGLGLASDDPGNVWGAFVGRLAEHYAAMGVHEWVIYARPNVRPGEGAVGFAGTEVDYARMLVVAREAARAVDPAAQIHVAAADWWIDVAAGRAPYLARLMAVFEAQDAEGASTEAFDAVWVRVASRTDDLDRLLTSTRAILDATGRTDAAVWLEANAVPTLDIPLVEVLPLFGVSTGQQADFIVQAAAMARAAGAAGMLVTPMADDDPAGLPGGLLREDGSARPAYAAYGHAIDWLGGAGTASRFVDDRGVLVMIEGPEEDVFVMWARTETPVRFLVTAETVGEVGRLITRGNERAISSEATVFPAVYAVDAPGAMRDANGFLTVAGSPRMLVVPASDFFRVGYVEIDGERFRIR